MAPVIHFLASFPVFPFLFFDCEEVLRNDDEGIRPLHIVAYTQSVQERQQWTKSEASQVELVSLVGCFFLYRLPCGQQKNERFPFIFIISVTLIIATQQFEIFSWSKFKFTVLQEASSLFGIFPFFKVDRAFVLGTLEFIETALSFLSSLHTSITCFPTVPSCSWIYSKNFILSFTYLSFDKMFFMFPSSYFDYFVLFQKKHWIFLCQHRTCKF